MQNTLYGGKDVGEKPSGSSGVDGDATLNRVVMEDLAEKTFEQRLEGGEGVKSHVVSWRKSLKKQGKEQVQRLRCGQNSKETSTSGTRDRGVFPFSGRKASFLCRNQSA